MFIKISCQSVSVVVYKNLNLNCLAKSGQCQWSSHLYSSLDYFEENQQKEIRLELDNSKTNKKAFSRQGHKECDIAQD